MTLRNSLLLSALAVASALSANIAAAADVGTATPEAQAQWYGRAGELVGSDRVTGLSAGHGAFGVAYDRDVATRTNMAVDRSPSTHVGVSYDQDVAARTNMGRSASQPVVAGHASDTRTN